MHLTKAVSAPSKGPPLGALDHRADLKICAVCGEIYNADDAREAFHHNQPDHDPLLPQR